LNVLALGKTKKTKKPSTNSPAVEEFSALNPNVFAFIGNQHSTSAWGDESDDEDFQAAHQLALQRQADVDAEAAAAQAEEEEDDVDEEEDSDSESEEEEEEEEETEKKPVVVEAPKKKAEPVKQLSKKEKKQLEMEELESALAELGIPGK
jgi:hypothetical protein